MEEMDISKVDEIVDVIGLDPEESKQRINSMLDSMSTWEILKIITDNDAVRDYVVEDTDKRGFNCLVTDYSQGRWCIYVQITQVNLL